MEQVWYKKWQVWLIVAIAAVAFLCLFIVGNEAKAENDRKAAIEDYIALNEELYPDTFDEKSISYKISDNVIEIERVHSGNPYEIAYASDITEDQMTSDMLAFEVRSPVIVYDYLTNGSLFGVQVGFADDVARGQGGDSNEVVSNKLAQAFAIADERAEKEKKAILKARCDELASMASAVDGSKSISEVHYEIEGDAVWFVAQLRPGHTIGFDCTDGNYGDTVQSWEGFAEFDTRLLRQPVGYCFYTSDGKLDLQAYSPVANYLWSPRSSDQGQER